jgi:uncharacterized OsmC-like protein
MYRVEMSNKGDYRFDVKAKDYDFVIHIKGSGVTPPDALLAAIGSCLGVYIRKYGEGTHLDIEDFNIAIEADFCKEHPVRFKTIDVSIDLKGAQLDDRRKAALLEFVKNCPVHNTLKGNPETKISFKL